MAASSSILLLRHVTLTPQISSFRGGPLASGSLGMRMLRVHATCRSVFLVRIVLAPHSRSHNQYREIVRYSNHFRRRSHAVVTVEDESCMIEATRPKSLDNVDITPHDCKSRRVYRPRLTCRERVTRSLDEFVCFRLT